jgi:colicin import membrane protein
MDASGKPGYIASSAAHVALLVLALVSFSRTPKFEDAQETIPIDLVTTQDFNQIMHGDKTAKQVQPKQRADKIADIIEMKPKPPVAEAKRDVPTPPPPLKRIADPGEDDKLEPPKPPAQAAAKPPPPEATKPAPVPPVTDKDAEAINPSKAQPAKDQPKKEEAKKPELRFDQIAKLLAEDKLKPDPKPIEASKPKSGDDSKDPPRKFSADDIARLLSKELQQRRAATNKELQQVASLGSETASAPQMSPSLRAQMEGWFQDHFQGCWTQPITLPAGAKYVPEIRVPLNLDGSLAADPTLLNPPDDAGWQPLADSAMRAVHTCDPLPVPDIYKAYYEEWRDRVVRFNDEDK